MPLWIHKFTTESESSECYSNDDRSLTASTVGINESTGGGSGSSSRDLPATARERAITMSTTAANESRAVKGSGSETEGMSVYQPSTALPCGDLSEVDSSLAMGHGDHVGSAVLRECRSPSRSRSPRSR